MAEGSGSRTPSEFSIAAVRLFCILLPGGIVTFFLGLFLDQFHVFEGVLREPMRGVGGVVAFVAASYVLGQFVYSVAARADELYDRMPGQRSNTLLYDLATRIRAMQEKALTEVVRGNSSEGPAPLEDMKSWQRHLTRLLVGKLPPKAALDVPIASSFEPADDARTAPRAIPKATDHPMDMYRFARVMLQLRHPAALLDVKRLEADSNFFRSLTLVLVLMAPMLLVLGIVVIVVDESWRSPLACAVGIAACWPSARLSFARYAKQRAKAAELAYQLLVASVIPPSSGREAEH